MRERETAREIEIYRVRSMQCRKRDIHRRRGRERKKSIIYVVFYRGKRNLSQKGLRMWEEKNEEEKRGRALLLPPSSLGE